MKDFEWQLISFVDGSNPYICNGVTQRQVLIITKEVD
jgi:hypothetical protein